MKWLAVEGCFDLDVRVENVNRDRPAAHEMAKRLGGEIVSDQDGVGIGVVRARDAVARCQPLFDASACAQLQGDHAERVGQAAIRLVVLKVDYPVRARMAAAPTWWSLTGAECFTNRVVSPIVRGQPVCFLKGQIQPTVDIAR